MAESNRSTSALPFDVMNQLETELLQLQALLHATYGNSGDAFRNMSDGQQDNYLWAVHSSAGRAHDLFKRLWSELIARRASEEAQR
jgi:hypothetical protein